MCIFVLMAADRHIVAGPTALATPNAGPGHPISDGTARRFLESDIPPTTQSRRGHVPTAPTPVPHGCFRHAGCSSQRASERVIPFVSSSSLFNVAGRWDVVRLRSLAQSLSPPRLQNAFRLLLPAFALSIHGNTNSATTGAWSDSGKVVSRANATDSSCRTSLWAAEFCQYASKGREARTWSSITGRP
jgi:hypothetical protein